MIKKLWRKFTMKKKQSQVSVEKKVIFKPVKLITDDDILMEFNKKRDLLIKK